MKKPALGDIISVILVACVVACIIDLIWTCIPSHWVGKTNWCPECEWEVYGGIFGVKYCWRCGTELVKNPGPPRCECGHKIYKRDKFCEKCGVELWQNQTQENQQ